MIKAKKNKVAIWMFRLVQKRKVRTMFAKLYVKDHREQQQPGLYIVNHSSWWDPMIVSELNVQKILHDVYVMTSYEGMKKVPIFKLIGAYSIDKDDPKHVLASLRYTEQLLKEKKTVCIFPQGEERHLEERPLEFQQGIAMIARRLPGIPVFPVTLYYSFRNTSKQEIWVQIGEAISVQQSATREQLNSLFETVLTEQLTQLKTDVIQNQTVAYKQYL
jgi:1-acyl-sn-glycerol-3-phosphate acyltransferase